MKTSSSMDVERAAKPFKHLIPKKDHNHLGDAKIIKLLRCHQNLTHLYNYHQLTKGKVYDGVVSRASAHVIDLLSGC